MSDEPAFVIRNRRTTLRHAINSGIVDRIAASDRSDPFLRDRVMSLHMNGVISIGEWDAGKVTKNGEEG